jgi:hypothetical protein
VYSNAQNKHHQEMVIILPAMSSHQGVTYDLEYKVVEVERMVRWGGN